jgi:phosphate transport system protein
MAAYLQKEIEALKDRILSLGAMVEENVSMVIKSVETMDSDIANRIIKSDIKIDEIEVEVEEECLKVLALHQPVAVDLRFITAVIKINNDLERIGDEAVNIAERVVYLASRPPLKVSFDYKLMLEKTRAMLKSSLDALVNLDLDLAYEVRLRDDEVDDINRDIYENIRESVMKNPERAGYLINLLSISRHLERIADHATNIAEAVIHIVEGVIPRHTKS